MYGAFVEIREVLVGQVRNVRPHVVLRHLDEERPDTIAHAARAAVQHEPDLVVLVQANLNEMIASSESAEMIDVIAAINLRIFFAVGLLPDLELPPHAGLTARDFAPRAFVALAAIVCAPVWYGLFDRAADVAQVIRQMIRIQSRLRCHYTAADIDSD